MKEKIKAAAVQFEHRANDKDYNFSKIEKFVKKAEKKGVELIAFPEMCITGYWHVRNLSKEQVGELAEPIPQGPSSQRLLELSEKHNMVIGAGLIEKGADGNFYNSYEVVQPNGEVNTHRKLQAFEGEHISRGNEYTVFDTNLGAKMGVLICYDNNILENMRMSALEGAQIMLAPHQTGGTGSRSPHVLGEIDVKLWEERKKNPEPLKKEFEGWKGQKWIHTLLTGQAMQNGTFVLFANGVGYDDGQVRTGNASIIHCNGEVLATTSEPKDLMVVADLNLKDLETAQGTRWKQARRPELYGKLTEPTGEEKNMREVRFGKT